MQQTATNVESHGRRWTAGAAAVALLGTAGTLWLSLGLGLKACPFCLYQRAFLMSALGVLLMSQLVGRTVAPLGALLALPAAAAGLGVAVLHVWLEAAGKLECPAGIFGWGSAPQQSLALLLLLVALLMAGARQARRTAGFGTAAVGAALLLGALLAWGTIASAPPPPPAPTQPYPQSPDMCRPPFTGGNKA